MEFHRILDLKQLLAKKTHFLFGPRSTGKSYLIKKSLAKNSHVIDLLDSAHYLRLVNRPHDLESLIPEKCKQVVIDEIQKVPLLLDEVHRLIEKKGIRFLLTGSSARKLKRGASNLLGGRARKAELFPLSSFEIPNFNLDQYLLSGGLPFVCASKEPYRELKDYIQTYLYEEIRAEGIVRKLPEFSRFLECAGLSNGQVINFTKVGQDAQVSPSTVREHYSVLEDTLLGFHVQPFRKTRTRKASATAKFYFFDTGVANVLAQTQSLDRNSDLYGRSFEHWVALELRAFLSYRNKDLALMFWRSQYGNEVDFVLGDQLAIEVKATRRLVDSDFKGLSLLMEEKVIKNFLTISHDNKTQRHGRIQCLHWKDFSEKLWAGKII